MSLERLIVAQATRESPVASATGGRAAALAVEERRMSRTFSGDAGSKRKSRANITRLSAQRSCKYLTRSLNMTTSP